MPVPEPEAMLKLMDIFADVVRVDRESDGSVTISTNGDRDGVALSKDQAAQLAAFLTGGSDG